MAITYKWAFGQAETQNKLGLVDVITIIPWILSATDGVRTVSRDSRIALPDPDPAKFVALKDVTEPLVTKWVEEAPAVELAYIKALLAAEFLRAAPAAPVATAVKPLPFNVVKP
jgi:hypothetical protein